MKPFEDELKRALARHAPSADFTDQVLARAVERRKGLRMPVWLSFSRLVWATALPLVFVSGLAYQQHLRTVRGQAAKKQLLMAIQIAGSQLHQAQLRVRRIEFPEVVMQ